MNNIQYRAELKTLIDFLDKTNMTEAAKINAVVWLNSRVDKRDAFKQVYKAEVPGELFAFISRNPINPPPPENTPKQIKGEYSPEIKLFTSEQIRGKKKIPVPSKQRPKIIKNLGFRERQHNTKCANIPVSAGAESSTPASHRIPGDVLSVAEHRSEDVGIELLALGKPGGDIFHPGHWMYAGIRDRFRSILVIGRDTEYG